MLAAASVRPAEVPALPINSTSGLATCDKVSASAPTVPPAPSRPGLLSLTLVVWVPPSSTMGVLRVGRLLLSVMAARPLMPAVPVKPVAVVAMLNRMCSMPAVRPTTARLASPASVLALVMAWRRLP